MAIKRWLLRTNTCYTRYKESIELVENRTGKKSVHYGPLTHDWRGGWDIFQYLVSEL